MIELLRNCSHGSDIATYLNKNDRSEKCIIKVAYTQSGSKDLKSEYTGWNWYSNLMCPHKLSVLCKIYQKENGFTKVVIPYIHGVKADYRKGLLRNRNTVIEVIKHYCRLWPAYSNTQSPIHGDLSIDNIICNSKGIHIIDWEHFNSNAAPWGFDAIYFLYETLWFGMRRRALPTRKEINILEHGLRILRLTNHLDEKIEKSPLKFVVEFIKENTTLWGKQLRVFPNKLPITNFTDYQINRIDEMLANMAVR